MHVLPWDLSLQVEVDGVLEGETHQVKMISNSGSRAAISCTAAFRPLVGKQFVAWRFTPPSTLTYAVKTPGCSEAAAESGATATNSEPEQEEEGEGEEDTEGEGEEGDGAAGAAEAQAQVPPPPVAPPGPQACHNGLITIKVTGWAARLQIGRAGLEVLGSWPT